MITKNEKIVSRTEALPPHINPNTIILAGFGNDGVRYNNLVQISEKLELLTEEQCYNELKEKSQREFKDSQICTLPSDSLHGKN